MKILPRHNIDPEKWDACVRKAWCEGVYGYTWYLDACCNWQGLVIGDYKAVMPLPVRKKYGIKYVYMPYACQKLGIYSEDKLSIKEKKSIFELLSDNYKFLDISIEDIGEFDGAISNRNIEMRLDRAYEDLKKAYSSNAKRNIKKAIKAAVTVEEIGDFDALADLYINNKVARGEAEFTDDDLIKMRQRFRLGFDQGKALLLGAKDPSGELLGAAMFVASATRYYFLFSGLTDEGKKCGAMFSIVDAFIQRHAGENMILDFEGSNHNGVSRFYKSFGGYETNYYRMRINNLPWPLNWIKR